MKRLAFLPLLALAACESQEPPAACGPIPQVTVNAGETAAVTACFNDPNGDMLVYSATSSNPGVATASVSGTDITVAAVAPGSASVTVTASDPGGLEGQQSFQVMVPNRPPQPRGAMPPVTVPVGRTEAVDASSYFAEPDGESLAYSATSSNPATATVSVAGSLVTVAAVAKGAAIVVVTATDPGGLAATQTFEVTVPNRAPVAGDPIADIKVFVGDGAEVDASGHFTDPDGDALTYTASSSSPANARVTVSGSTVRVTAASQGSATVTVTATDPEGLSATQTFEVTVPNRAPVAGDPIADIEVFVGDGAEVDASGHFTDPDGDALTYTASSSSPANARVTVSGSTVRVTAASQGSATVTVTATDPEGLSATQTFEVTVPNRAPVAGDPIADIKVFVGDGAEVDASGHFTDPDGDALTYTASSSSPANARVTVSGSTVRVTAASQGSATVTVTATDPEGLSATQTFEVTVPNRAPVAGDPIADIEVFVGDGAEVDASGHFTDPDGDALTYTATSSSPANATSSVLSGSLVTVWGLAKGNATVTVTATDPEGLAATQTFRVTVPNRAPEAVGTIADREVAADATAEVDVSRHFTDPDGDRLTYAAKSSKTHSVGVSVSGSTVTVRGVAKGSATVTVTATDPEGLAATQTFRVTVPNRVPKAAGNIPDQKMEVDDNAEIDVEDYFSDPDGDDLTYTARSSKTNVATVSVSGSTVTIRAVATGSATVTVTARDPGGLTATQRAGVTVRQTNRAPKAVGNIPDQKMKVDTGVEIDVEDYFSDPDGDDLTYTARSSKTNVATVSVSGSTVTIRAVAAGRATVTVTARDPGRLTARQTASVSVIAVTSPDREVLVALYEATDGPNWRDNTNWLTDKPLGEWYGVDTNASGRVVGLDLRDNRLAGEIPPELGDLSNLEILHLPDNSLTGEIPLELGDLSNLENLNLRRNSLTGEIPRGLGDLADLEELYLDDNDLSGEIPLDFVDLSLTTFYWDGNTGLCSPATKSFQDWLRSIDDHRGGKACGTFDLEMNFTSGVSSTVRSHIEEARDEWELVLKNTEFDDIRVNRTLSCLGIRGYVGTIDDHRLFVHADSIDGEGGILAVARYCYRRTSDGSPLLSATVIDEDDIEEMIDEDALVPVVFHEMGHALGFPGYWFYHDLVDTLDADDPHFEGKLAIEAFDDAGGDDYDGEKVPIQLRRYGHWRESVFGDEIMSPFIDLENDEAPVSAITLQSFADVGYKVDVSRADDYELPDTQDRRSTGRVFDLSNDVVWGPVIVLDTDGRVVRVIPPPPGAERWPLPRREVLIEPRRPPRHGSTPPSSGSRSR